MWKKFLLFMVVLSVGNLFGQIATAGTLSPFFAERYFDADQKQEQKTTVTDYDTGKEKVVYRLKWADLHKFREVTGIVSGEICAHSGNTDDPRLLESNGKVYLFISEYIPVESVSCPFHINMPSIGKYPYFKSSSKESCKELYVDNDYDIGACVELNQRTTDLNKKLLDIIIPVKRQDGSDNLANLVNFYIQEGGNPRTMCKSYNKTIKINVATDTLTVESDKYGITTSNIEFGNLEMNCSKPVF